MPKKPLPKPKVDHRELDLMKQLMSEIGFQVYKINKDDEKEGIELEVGDYEQEISPTGEKIVVERKSEDFLPSVFSKHLDEQLADIVSDEKVVTGFLIIDKTLDDLIAMAHERDISENVVYGAIASLALKGFPPIFCGDVINFRNVVAKIFEKGRDGKERIFVPKLRIKKSKAIVTFPGVNEELGIRLLKIFGSIKNIINASKEELMTVDGIGEKTAKKIVELVNEE